MEPVEQIFLRVSSTDGFRTAEIVTATELVRVSDMTEIVGWFTDSEENSIIRFDTLNVFFHPLPSGDYAIGLLYPDQRGFFSFLQPPSSFFVRILLVPPRTLLLKGGNPVALYEEFRRRRKIPLVSRAPKHLSPIQPLKTPLLLDRDLVEVLSPKFDAMATVMQSLFDSECTFLHSPKRSVTTILDGLFNLLPPSYRTELTFSTELFFSVQNPFRLIGLGGSANQAEMQAKTVGMPFVGVEKQERNIVAPASFSPWPLFVRHILRHRLFDFLQRQWEIDFERARLLFEEDNMPIVDWEQLHELAVSWKKAMGGSKIHDTDTGEAPQETPFPEFYGGLRSFESLLPMLDEESRQGLPPRMASKPGGSPAERMPHLRNEIKELDSLLTRFAFGDDTLPNDVRTAWQAIRAKTSREEREMLCEEYLALVRLILMSDPDPGRPRPAERSAALLQLMSILLESDQD